MIKIRISLGLLILSTVLLNGCFPVVQTASTVHTALSVGNDRRSAGTIVDDNYFYLQLTGWSFGDEKLKNAHLNFMAYDKTVLIAGEVPTLELKHYLDKQTKLQVPKIKRIFNEVTVGPNSGLLSRAKDSAITLQIEARFQNQEVFNPTRVKVMSERQVIYLMGAVTKREADMATKVVKKVKGVKKIVKLFDYLAKRPRIEIEHDKQRALAEQKQAELKEQQAELKAKKSELQRQIKALGGNTTGTSFSPE